MIRWTLPLALLTALSVGCDDKSPDPPKADPNPKVPTVDDLKMAGENMKDKVTDASKDASAVAADAAKRLQEEGASWVTKLQDAIKANKLDEAKTYIDKIEPIKDKLPDAVKTQYANAKKLFDDAKSKLGNLVPGGTGIPGQNK